MSHAIRRVSVQTTSALAQLATKESGKDKVQSKLRKISVISTRNIPVAAQTAQELAVACASNIAEVVKKRQTVFEANRKSSERARAAPPIQCGIAGGGIPAAAASKGKEFRVPEQVYSDLIREISLQRKLLKPSVQETFDMQWG